VVVVEVVVVVVSLLHFVGTSWQSSVPSNAGDAHGHEAGHGFDKKYHAPASVDQRDTHVFWHAVVVLVLVLVVVV